MRTCKLGSVLLTVVIAVIETEPSSPVRSLGKYFRAESLARTTCFASVPLSSSGVGIVMYLAGAQLAQIVLQNC